MNMFLECRPILSALLRNKTGALLIALQIALTLAVLCNALYIIGDRLEVAKRPSGAIEDEVFLTRVVPFREITNVKDMQLADEAALRAIPGVKSVTWTNQAPLARSDWTTGLAVDRAQRNETLNAAQYIIPGSLVDTLGLNLLEGREFHQNEIIDVNPDDGSLPELNSVILSLAAAKKMFPETSSFVGKTIYWGTGDEAPALTIVGIVEKLQSPHAPVGEQAEYSMILPARFLQGYSQYLVRTAAEDRAKVMAEAENVLSTLRNDRVVLSTRGIDEYRESRYRAENALSNMLLTVTGLMLLITASGIVGMATLWVNQRRKQIGIRRALGAMKQDILRYFITENLLISGFGILLGVGLTLSLNHVLVSVMELSRLPLMLLAYGIVTLVALGVIAVLGPAWKGASVPAAEATRSV
ncbi:ABC transporter permease [Permianibacter aggregans]|uniref:Putative ABC transport system permease protein n=1 Tax=Permianibacter aggregans TaxID=1510150 RepID=A0A4R6UM75_9GAMM|nr:FtsX-like permease family protein [Permianibacter aggregans]TDQ48178.1 putative ABC transport system permease protein [Permianibacter aggregans]